MVTCWVLWAGLDSVSQPVQANVVGFELHSAERTSVTFTIETAPGHPVACIVEAQNEDFAVVGWRIIRYPAATDRVRTVTETVRTTEKAVTGLVDNCWLA